MYNNIIWLEILPSPPLLYTVVPTKPIARYTLSHHGTIQIGPAQSGQSAIHRITCTEMKSYTRVWPKWNYMLSPSAHTHHTHSPQYHDFVVSPRRVCSSRGTSFDVVIILLLLLFPHWARHGTRTRTRVFLGKTKVKIRSSHLVLIIIQ